MIFITGASSAGKTSLIDRLKKQLSRTKFDIHDIDEADRWTDNYEEWRDAKIEFWLQQSIKNREKGIETILCGIIYPKHVIRSPSYEAAAPVRYILLDADEGAIRERSYKRIESRISTQLAIAKDLKGELEDLKNKQIINTTNLSIENIAITLSKKLEK